ncbi:MAG: hypothetical protein OXU20_37455 [Myxococcales bacterium]|nr:hypothetical protein [Myxococcales bacterium]MDD9965935.1 hypothetical protein [Myxococcales bacterium]
MQRLDVHVVALEVDHDTVVAGLQNRFGLPKQAAERFLQRLPRVARYQADVDEANAYRRVLTELGVRVVLRPSGSSIPQMDVPSLPVPAHGPSGITRSMRAFASSARLANHVPRAPALPEDLTGPQVLEFVDQESDPPEVSDSWLAGEAKSGNSGEMVEFGQLSPSLRALSAPQISSGAAGGEQVVWSARNAERYEDPGDSEAAPRPPEGKRPIRWPFVALALIALAAAAWLTMNASGV